MNVLELNKSNQFNYSLKVDNDRPNEVQGAIVCICEKRYNAGGNLDLVWEDIIKQNGNTDSLTYIMTATRGSTQLTYVGKTLNKIEDRYQKGPTGGLKLIFDMFEKGDAMLDCVLYNASHPALVELWCFQLLEDRNSPLANYQDPS